MRVVVVDPDPLATAMLRSMFTEAGHEVLLTQSAGDVLEFVGREAIDVVVVNGEYPSLDARLLCSALRQNGYDNAVIAVYAHADPAADEPDVEPPPRGDRS